MYSLKIPEIAFFPDIDHFRHAASRSEAAEHAPEAEVQDVRARLLDSDAVARLSQLRGMTVIINFWATRGTSCKAEMPLLLK